MKQLAIFRHAKSDWGDSSLDDWQRPLSARGIIDAPRVGEMLRERSSIPDLIITSDAIRARSTAEAVAEAAGYTGAIFLEPALYLATPDAILKPKALRPFVGRPVASAKMAMRRAIM